MESEPGLNPGSEKVSDSSLAGDLSLISSEPYDINLCSNEDESLLTDAKIVKRKRDSSYFKFWSDHVAPVLYNRFKGRGYQAIRCPYCKALVAVGPSYKDHTFFCAREART